MGKNLRLAKLEGLTSLLLSAIFIPTLYLINLYSKLHFHAPVFLILVASVMGIFIAVNFILSAVRFTSSILGKLGELKESDDM